MAEIVSIGLILAGIYVLVGLGLAIFWTIKGLELVDETAAGATKGFKAIIFPGLVAFWPWILRKWMQGKQSPG